MPCYFPLSGYKSNRVNEKTGKRSLVFNKNHGFVDLPVTVPCGSCIGCRIDRSRAWALRCVHEAKFHQHSCFLTLTYDDDNKPLGGSLVKSDLQKFFKRLRKQYGSFRYFACGEYGDSTARPHFHCIIFGLDFSHDRKQHSKNKRGDIIYSSNSLSKIWGFGHCTIGKFNYSTASYTARYVMKKQTGKNAQDHSMYTRLDPVTGELYQVTPEFALMSRKPGLGSMWYDQFKDDAFPSDFLIYEGKKHTVPSFYFNKLKVDNPDLHKQIAVKRSLAQIDAAADNTGDRLFSKFVVKTAKISQLQRSI